MRTVRTKVFKFDELSDKAKEKAVKSLSDAMPPHDWSKSLALSVIKSNEYEFLKDGSLYHNNN